MLQPTYCEGLKKKKKKIVLHSTFQFGNPTELIANE